MRRRIRSAAPSVHRFALAQVAVDGMLVALAYVLAYRLRFDGALGVPPRYEALRDATLVPLVTGTLIVFSLFGLYAKSWRHLTGGDYVQVVYAAAVATLVLPAYNALFQPVVAESAVGRTVVGVPTSIIALHGLLSLLAVGAVRFAVRRFYERPPRGFHARRGARGVLIVGAGDGGRLVLREILRNPGLGLRPVGFVDDDPRKRRNRVEGVRVLGSTGDLPRILEEAEPDEVTIAIPSAPGVLRARVVRACRERGIPVRTLPTVFELLQTQGHLVRQAREVRVEDVLGREPVRMELDRVGAYLTGEVVLVTGAGGSIGSELARQIARVGPRRLVLLDHAEDNLFAIHSELTDDRHVHPALLSAVLADCKEEERMREVFSEHRPTVVFHAAAYKHVGLMETNPVEAVRNNAIATRVVARVAGDHSVKAFVLVSTDKAVAPATVMGASKALAEFAVEAEQAHFPATSFSAVRFGNVLGSSGSVVPVFRRQIARGGPVTVTDERMTRYFMTIPEAVQLIIRSGGLGQGGEIFVLEMGEPVAIMDLARAMIELSGLVPEDDVVIEVTGRRPGEKLHEDLFNAYERPVATEADKIQRAGRATLDPRSVDAMFDEIGLLVLEGDAAALARKVGELSTLHRSVQEAGEQARAVEAGEQAVRLPPFMATAALPPALVGELVNDIGAYAGIAAIVGLAVLSLLYFTQAREVKRLREWAGRAPERDAELAARVRAEAMRPRPTAGATGAQRPGGAQVGNGTQQSPNRPPQPPGVPAAPGRASGASVGAGGVAGTAIARSGGSQQHGAQPDQASGQGVQPAQASGAQPAQAPGPDAGSGQQGAERPRGGPPPSTAAARPRPATGPAAPPTQPPGGAVDQDTADRQAVRAAAAAASGSGGATAGSTGQRAAALRRSGGASASMPARGLRPKAPPPPVAGEGPRDRRRTIALIGGGALAALLVGVLVLTQLLGGDEGAEQVPAPSNSAPTAQGPAPDGGPPPRGEVNVAVLNGTNVNNLAEGVAQELESSGFQRGVVDTNSVQTLSATTVEYAEGMRASALEVAEVLGLEEGAVDRISANTRALARDEAEVVVLVGNDGVGRPAGDGATGSGGAAQGSGATGGGTAEGTGGTGSGATDGTATP